MSAKRVKKFENILDIALGHWHRIVSESSPDEKNGWNGVTKCIQSVSAAMGELIREENIHALRAANAMHKSLSQMESITIGFKALPGAEDRPEA